MKDLITKTPNENVPILFDFSEHLAEGETITGAILAVNAMNGLDATPQSHVSSPQPVAAEVYTLFTAGTRGEDYMILCRATTSNGQVLDSWAIQKVRDPLDA